MSLRLPVAAAAIASLLALAPPASASERAPEYTLHVFVTGAGPAVVVIPGLAGGAFAFRNVVPLLRESGCTVIVIEPLGVGASGRPRRGDYSLSAQTDRIADALDTLHVRDAVVVGHARGASIAMRLAYRRPELVRAILSIEGGAAEAAAGPALRRAMRWARLIKLFGTGNGLRKRIRDQMIESSGNPAWVRDEVVEGYAAPAVADFKRTIDVLAGMAKSREPDSLRPHLGSIPCCVELLVGDAPHLGAIDSEQIETLRQQLRCFSLSHVPGTGHFIQEERPEAILAEVTRLARFTHEERTARQTSADALPGK